VHDDGAVDIVVDQFSRPCGDKSVEQVPVRCDDRRRDRYLRDDGALVQVRLGTDGVDQCPHAVLDLLFRLSRLVALQVGEKVV
jgi:hypothetical protein